MGNCQAAEVAAVVIQHPGGKVERVYWSVSASRVMADNPGHYVAVIITAPASSGHERKTNNAGSTRHGTRRVYGGTDDGRATVKHLKLLRPDDTLLMGHVYRLVSFEEVVRKFETKRHAKLGKLVVTGSNVEMSTTGSTDGRTETEKECQGEGDNDAKKAESEKNQDEAICDKSEEDDEETDELVSVAQALISSSRMPELRPGRQWRPALQSISEVAGT